MFLDYFFMIFFNVVGILDLSIAWLDFEDDVE